MQDRFAPPPARNLVAGRPYLAIPGPSVMPDRVLAAMHRAAPNIYGAEIIDLVSRLKDDLRQVACSQAGVACYIGNGHAAWEAANANLFSRGDRALVLATGHFGHGWARSASAMGVAVEVMDFGQHAPVDAGRLEAALRADHAGTIRAVLLTQVDTATSVKNDIAVVRRAMDAAGHPALLVVDCIATLACDDYRMDDWGVDVTVAACQKGLMTPPGLGFLWVSDRALAACKSSDLRTPYWDWTPRIFGTDLWQHFCGTAPTHHLFGLAEAMTMILREEGLSQVWARHHRLARAVWAAFDVWGQGNPAIAMNVAQPAHRGWSVTAARIGAPDARRLREWTEVQGAVTLGIGLGMETGDDPQADGFLRVAHMGHVNAHMTLGALAVMQAGMVALGIPHGAGGLDAAARVVGGV